MTGHPIPAPPTFELTTQTIPSVGTHCTRKMISTNNIYKHSKDTYINMFYFTFEIATHGIPPLYVHGFNFIFFLQILTFVYALIIKRFTLIKFLTIQNNLTKNLHTCVATITEPSCITSSVALSCHVIATTFTMAYTC